MSSTITAPRMKLKTGTRSPQAVRRHGYSRPPLLRNGGLRRHREDAEGARLHGGVDPRRPRGLQEDRSGEARARARGGHVRGQQRALLDDGRARGHRRRGPGLPRRRDALGRRHDRRRDDRQVHERLLPSFDLPQHQLDLPRGQARVPAARAGGLDLGPAGVHEGCRPEPRGGQPRQCSAASYKELPEGWTFETKILDEELSLDTGRAGGWAAIIRDEFDCTYQGCGYGADTSANYVP